MFVVNRQIKPYLCFMSVRDGARLREERLRRGWTLTYVTQITGISSSDLSQIELGKRYAFRGWRERLARAYGLPPEDLFPMRSAA